MKNSIELIPGDFDFFLSSTCTIFFWNSITVRTARNRGIRSYSWSSHVSPLVHIPWSLAPWSSPFSLVSNFLSLLSITRYCSGQISLYKKCIYIIYNLRFKCSIALLIINAGSLLSSVCVLSLSFHKWVCMCAAGKYSSMSFSSTLLLQEAWGVNLVWICSEHSTG